MHEWSMAEAVIAAVIDEAEREGLDKVTESMVRVGGLQQMENEVFEFALNELKGAYGGSILEDARIILEREDAVLRCRFCGNEWKFSGIRLCEDEYEAIHFCPEVSHAYIRCPSCKSPDFDLLTGRGVSIAWIKGVKGEEDGSESEHP